jgi:DNA modification methylase
MQPRLEIVYRPVAELIPYARNARTHSDAQIADIAASIREFGFTNPLLIDSARGMIAGHGRLLAARKLGMTEVPTIELAHLTPIQRRAYVLTDNRMALSAGWDDGMLRAELEELAAADFDLLLTGFGTDEIDKLLLPNPGQTDPDEAPAAPTYPAARVGDLWRLGRHVLVCGDCTDPEAVRRALGGVVPHLMVTDPPYGVDYDPDWRNHALRADGTTFGGRAIGTVDNDDRVDWSAAWALFPGDVAYVWHASMFGAPVQASLEAHGFALRSQIIWAKQQFVIGRGHYHWQHEACWYAVRKGKTGHWVGDHSQATVWSIDKPMKSETGHSTQKPVECMRRPIENNSSVGQAVYEPFCGSGTTIIAAEMTGRCCIALEVNPAYVDVAIQRWQNFAGQAAMLQSESGAEPKPYAAILAEREPLLRSA